MQDHFMEEVVVKHKNGFNRALYMLSWVIIILPGLTAAIMLSGVTSSLSQGGIHWPSVIMLLLCGGIPLTDALYEVVSALGTVGLSRGLTPRLDTVGRIIIIASMFLGRIGPISMAVLFTKGDQPKSSIKHSEGTFYVG